MSSTESVGIMWASVSAALFGFLSFHFLYTDGWSFDGTLSKLKEMRERIYPSAENRTENWWRAPFGYCCAILSTILWIVAAATNK
jgi:hypothetical protein